MAMNLDLFQRETRWVRLTLAFNSLAGVGAVVVAAATLYAWAHGHLSILWTVAIVTQQLTIGECVGSIYALARRGNLWRRRAVEPDDALTGRQVRGFV